MKNEIFADSLLPNVFDTLNDGVLITDGHEVFYANRNLKEKLPVNYSIGFPCRIADYFQNKKLGKLHQKISDALETEGSFKFLFDDYQYDIKVSKVKNGAKEIFSVVFHSLKVEGKYRANQKKLRQVLDLVPHIIFLKDKKGKILLANQAAANFYKTDPKKLVYSNIKEYHPSKPELENMLMADKAVILKGEKLTKTTTVTDIDDQKHILDVVKVPYVDTMTTETHSLSISMDVTEKHETEKAVKDVSEKYRLLIERGSDGILIIQKEKIVFANKQVAKIIGEPIEELLGNSLGKFVRSGQLEKTFFNYAFDVKNKKFDNYYEVKIAKTDGENVYVEAKLSTINYEGEKSRLVFVRDITKRKIAEKKSLRDKNLLEQAQKITKIGSWEWDIQRKSFICSEEIYRILEIEAGTAKHKGPKWLLNFIPDQEKENIKELFFESIRSLEHLDLEFPIASSLGAHKIVHSQSQSFNDRFGNPERVIGTWMDISDRIHFEQILKEAKEKAEESDKLKSAFLANMSHEIRTPMNAILGFSNLLKKSELAPEVRDEYIEHIQQSGKGLLNLIEDIVDISKIESNQIKIENHPIRINEMLDQLYNRYDELLLLNKKNSINLVLEKAMPDPDFTVVSDAFRLQQVISNLLNNAIKFTVDGKIKFGYNITNSELQFFVHDEGIGIPETKQRLIFKRFGKLDDPARMNKSGTGLGLSISKSLIGLMGGQIWLDCGDPGNTMFCFTIPLKFAKEGETAPQKKTQANTQNELNLRSKKILIAEDELLNYKLLEALLIKTGATVLWAKTGVEAVDIALDESPDLIFMDIKMPKMNGYEATKAIKKVNSSVPIIAQTAFAFSNEKEYILKSGCDMYLTKPIDHKEVFKVLEHYLVTE